jgi:hypothetical protein
MARIHDGRLLFDARTVLPGEGSALVEAIVEAVAAAIGAEGRERL